MATDNLSPSYLAERARVRRWLEQHPDGREAMRVMRGSSTPAELNAVLEDEKQTDWEELQKDYRGASLLAASCREGREAFELARQSSSIMGPPKTDKQKWVKFFSPPLSYVLRRQIELSEPDYWNIKVNVYREALAHPEWCTAPADYIRGALENCLPRGQQVA
jgi:hypothetical protein